jgi:hypothetical protein
MAAEFAREWKIRRLIEAGRQHLHGERRVLAGYREVSEIRNQRVTALIHMPGTRMP